jgi:hypothetical protein
LEKERLQSPTKTELAARPPSTRKPSTGTAALQP